MILEIIFIMLLVSIIFIKPIIIAFNKLRSVIKTHALWKKNSKKEKLRYDFDKCK